MIRWKGDHGARRDLTGCQIVRINERWEINPVGI
jgi:hypothetical protein